MFANDMPKSPIEYPNNRFPFNSRGRGRGNVSSMSHQKTRLMNLKIKEN